MHEPEPWEVYWDKVIDRMAKLTPDAVPYDHIGYYRGLWQMQEREKAGERKAAADEKRKEQIEQQKFEREVVKNAQNLRAINRKIELREKEEQKTLERAAEKERKDPLPNVLSSDTTPSIPFAIRDRHIFIPGASRHGKSTQFFHLIMNDIVNGRGVAVLDPIKGDLITDLLPYIPPSRLKDCIYLDLKNPIPLDVMRPTPYPEELIGDIKALVLKGDANLSRAEPILTRLLYALLSIPGSKFTDIEDVFTLPKRKEWFLGSLEKIDPRRFEYWKNNWPEGGHFSPLLYRMTDFTENPSLRIILGDTDPILNLRQAMDNRKIILVSLPGSSEVTRIYGSLLISRFQQAAFSRAEIPKNDRVPFCLYVDEFEVFQTSSFAKILEAAGGLKLFLTIGNQHVFQLSDEIRHGVFGNVGTFIIFKLGEAFDLFSSKVHPYKPYRIGLIPQYQAIYKIGDNPPEFHWTKPAPYGKELPPDLLQRSNLIRQFLIQQTKDQYSRSGQKRSVDNSPSVQSNNVLELREDDGTTILPEKPSAINPRKPRPL